MTTAIIKLTAAISSSLLLFACTQATPPEPEKPATSTESLEAAVQAKTAALKLYAFECGEILSRDVSLFSPGVDQGEAKELSNSCYLIQHPKGNLLWDTGLNDSIGPKGIDVWDGAFNMKVTKPLMSQLAQLNISPNQINLLGISHFHGDHTGNANQFPSATLLIQQEEFDAAFGQHPDKFGFNADSYKQLDPSKAIKLQGDYDVFADGKVVIKRATGHTPGHQMLLVNLENTGPVLLSGDIYHFTKNREHQRVPSFNFDKAQTIEAMAMTEAFIKDSGAQLWIQHDKEQNMTIKHSPEYYD